jgi:phosphohistidine phosphatase
MILLLVRHADAVAGGPDLDDAHRWLSAHGRARARGAARALASHGLAITRVLTSPRVRAVQTAELFAQELAFDAPIEVLPSLCFETPALAAVGALRELHGVTVAVGHMPTLAEMVKQLTQEGSARSLDTASVTWVEDGRVVRTLRAG